MSRYLSCCPGTSCPTLLAPSPKLVIDLERMAQLPKDKAGPLARYVATIQSQRGDYNGRVLSIRQEDLRSLAVIYDKTPTDLTEELISWGILDSDARGAIEDVLNQAAMPRPALAPGAVASYPADSSGSSG